MRKLFLSIFLLIPRVSEAQIFQFDALIRAVRGEVVSQNVGTHDLDAATDAIEIIQDVKKARTYTEICLPYLARQVGDPPVHTFSIQGVNATTGRADGTIKSSSNATCTMDPPSGITWDNTNQCCTMTSSYAATAGERLALVATCAGCTASLYGRWIVNLGGEMKTGYPTGWTVNGGVATRFSRYTVGGFGTGSVFDGLAVTGNYATNSTYSSGSTPDERGLRFNRNDGCTSYVLGPVTYMGRGPAAGTTATWTLYDTDGTTALATATIDGDIQGITPATNDHYIFEFAFNATPTLTCGSTYRIAQSTADAASTIAIMTVPVASTRQDALFLGTSADYTTRTDAGAWTNDAATRPIIAISYDTVTFPSGGTGSDSQFNKGFN